MITQLINDFHIEFIKIIFELYLKYKWNNTLTILVEIASK